MIIPKKLEFLLPTLLVYNPISGNKKKFARYIKNYMFDQNVIVEIWKTTAEPLSAFNYIKNA